MARRQMLQQAATNIATGTQLENASGAEVIDFKSAAAQLGAEPEDRFPGSFFRIPGRSAPGRTTWSLSE